MPQRFKEINPKPWPYRPQPLPDELISSYLWRLSNGMMFSPSSFLSIIFGTRKNLLAQDLDNYTPDHIFQRVAFGTQINIDDLARHSLRAYVGTLHLSGFPTGRRPWILPVSVNNNDRQRPGLQYCPSCLTEDSKPYFRRIWRLAFVTCCTRHGTLLIDRCPQCHRTIQLHKTAPSIQCYHCDHPLKANTTAVVNSRHIAWQKRLETWLEHGWAKLGDDYIYSHFAFAIVRQIATLLVNGKFAPALRQATSLNWGGDPTPFDKPTRRQPFEYLSVSERHRLFELVEHLMQGWPSCFVHACLDAKLTRCQAIRDMTNPPFMYEQVMRSYLDRTPYFAQDAEVAAAAAWLRRTKGAATYNDLRAICGESRAAIYRHMDYVRPPAKPSQWRARSRSI